MRPALESHDSCAWPVAAQANCSKSGPYKTNHGLNCTPDSQLAAERTRPDPLGRWRRESCIVRKTRCQTHRPEAKGIPQKFYWVASNWLRPRGTVGAHLENLRRRSSPLSLV